MSPAAAPQRPPHMTAREAAEYLRVSLSTLARLDIAKAKFRGRVIYRVEVLDDFVRSHEAK
jgi:hypothetical protein